MTIDNNENNEEIKTQLDIVKSSDIGRLLTLEMIYDKAPINLNDFYEKYKYFNPKLSKTDDQILKFINISKKHESKKITLKRLNDFINIKFHPIEQFHDYNYNKKLFTKFANDASSVIKKLLKFLKYENGIKEIFFEKEEVSLANEPYELLLLYKKGDQITKFEIIRKLGLINLINVIKRSIDLSKISVKEKYIKKAFIKGLDLWNYSYDKNLYFWLDEKNNLVIEKSFEKAKYKNTIDSIKRKGCGLKAYNFQKFKFSDTLSLKEKSIIKLDFRTKFDEEEKYTSIIEKMIRKNLEFPNQIHDIFGMKIIVKNQENIISVIKRIESFLGGSSTRKKEKDTYHKFNVKNLTPYSSKEFLVWKAVYDVPIPNTELETIKRIQVLSKNIKNSKELKKFLKEKKSILLNNPLNVVVEVQIQDKKSYLKSIALGSNSEHRGLKYKEFTNNTFFKLFPQEIYKPELDKLKEKILAKSN